MGASHNARAGIPISVKLVLATSFVIAAAIGTATWFSTTSIKDVTRIQLAKHRETGELAITHESEVVANLVARGIAVSLANSSLNDVSAQLDRVLIDDHEDLLRQRALQGRPATPPPERIQWLVITMPCEGSKTCVGEIATASNLALAERARPVVADATALDKLQGQREAFARGLELERLKGQLLDAERHGSVVHANLGNAAWVYGVPVMLNGRTHGELWMGVTTRELEDQLAAVLQESEDSAQRRRNRMLLVSLLVLAIGIVLAALQGIQLARPIKTLTAQAARLGAGDLRTRAPEGRRDELGVLARTFNVMAAHITELLAHQAEKASLEKEMELARQVQQAMLPPDQLDQHGALKVVGYCMPASSCGGDWWTYRKLSGGRMLLVVGDATGHGIHSAMIAATARGAVEALSGIDERLLTPEQVLRAIDSAIRQVGEHNVIMTAFAAVFDSTNGILHYANAGQNFPYVIKLDGTTRILGEASIIAASGNPLGDRNIAVEIRRGSLQLRAGDLFVCFTDGVVERANRAGKLFGDRRLRGALTGQALPDGSALLRLRDGLVHTLERYAEGVDAEDDITFVLCQYDPPAVRSSAGRGAA